LHRLDGRDGKPAREPELSGFRCCYRDIHARAARLVMDVQAGLTRIVRRDAIVMAVIAVVVMVISAITVVVAMMHMPVVGMLVDVQERPRESPRGCSGRHADRRRQGKQDHQHPDEGAAGSACSLQSNQRPVPVCVRASHPYSASRLCRKREGQAS
jgi:hypothetical protein